MPGVAVACVPASGSWFPVGVTTVTCTASTGATCSFTVTVNDATPPAVACPADVSVTTSSPDGAVVTFADAVATDLCSTPTIAYSAASGSTFPVGDTLVVVTATDASGNATTCSFTVTVIYEPAP